MSSSPPRQVFIDRLRIALTAWVILHHVAIVYGGSGGWYWREEANGSNRLLLYFNAVNQSFFMGFFFLLAGYYTPTSYDRKGAGRFLVDRFWRLGVPLLIYFFLLSPMTIALARMSGGNPFWSGWWLMIRGREFEPGPLWFAEALLILALLYVVWRRLVPRDAPDLQRVPSFGVLALAAAGVGIVSFLVRLYIPVGQTIAWLQLGYFPAYILLFIVGCRAARSRLLENITFADARVWGLVSLGLLILFPVVIATRGAQGSFVGGWTLNAAFYALWDPFIAWGIILLLLWFFRSYASTETPLSAALARRAYAAYIIHPPVVVGLSLLARGWTAPALVKFGAVGLISCVGAFAAASVLLLVPGSRKVL